MKLIKLAFILILITPSASIAMTRGEAVAALVHPSFGMLVAEDFEIKKNDEGIPIAVAEKIEDKSVLASVIGKPNNIQELNMMAVFTEENYVQLMLYIPFLVARAFPEWDGSTKWAGDALINLSQIGGGNKVHTSNGKTVEIRLMQFGNGVVGKTNIVFQ